MSKRQFVLLMSSIMAMGPFAVDVYLPGIPSMAAYLGVGTEHIATTISYYIFGMAIGQLIGGPLADRMPKRTLIVAGLSIFAISCLIITASHSLHLIQGMRILQAIGGGFAIVCIAPLVRQREHGNAAAKLFGLIGLIFIIAPAIAPSIGALILLIGDWQYIFYFMTLYAVIVALVAWFSLPRESAHPTTKALSPLPAYLWVMKNGLAMRYLLIQSLGYSVMMVFVTNSSFIYQQHFGLSGQMFGLLFAANTVFNVVANRINTHFLTTLPANTLLRVALACQGIFVILLLIFTYAQVPVAIFAIGIIGAAGIIGAILPNTNALFISLYKENTGSASALLGAAQFTAGAVMGGLTTLFYNQTLWPIVIIMTGLVLVTNLTTPKTAEEDRVETSVQ